jgi:hypothetical protein
LQVVLKVRGADAAERYGLGINADGPQAGQQIDQQPLRAADAQIVDNVQYAHE